MASDVNLVGSRIPMMHVGYDCPGCANSVTVTMIDGGRDSDGHRRVVQQPRDCPNCGEKIQISLVADPTPGG